MQRFLVVLAVSILVGPAAALAAGGGGGGDLGGGSGGGGGMNHRAMDEKIAARKFDRAKQHLEDAKAAEAKLAAATDDKQRKDLNGDIKDAYEDARDELKGVVKKQPTAYPAWSELGFAQRKLGKFDDSIDAYDHALELKPSYAPAIEYRGEAYLEAGKLTEARGAWQKLSDLDHELADQLLGTMQHWLARQKEQPSPGVTPEALADFESWLAERKLSDLPPSSVRAAASGW